MEPARFSAMPAPLTVRKEVEAFIQAAEILLSPALRNYELTPDECELIRDYVMALSNAKQPWSKGLPIKYA